MRQTASWKPGASAPVDIDFDGLMARAVPVPIPSADIVQIDARGDKIYLPHQPAADDRRAVARR